MLAYKSNKLLPPFLNIKSLYKQNETLNRNVLQFVPKYSYNLSNFSQFFPIYSLILLIYNNQAKEGEWK